MSAALYELTAGAMRYFFALLMLLIVFRAWRITVTDARRAARLRRMSPQTGLCGEFLVIRGNGRVRDGMRWPVIREGLIGSAGRADVRLRSGSVRRAHAFFERTPKGLRVRACPGAKVYNGRGESRRTLLLGDGSRVTLGRVELMLILTDAAGSAADPDEEDTLFDTPRTGPAQAPDPADGLFRVSGDDPF